MALDPFFLNMAATALVLLAVGLVLGRERAGAWPPVAPWLLAFLALGTLGLLRGGVALEDWTIVFAAAFAFGWYVGAPPVAWTPRVAGVGAALGLGGAAVVLFLAATHAWWYGPLALLVALGVGVARHAWGAVRAWRLGSAGDAPPRGEEPPP